MSDSYQKHSTHTDALDTLGKLIGPDEGRDAIHLAVENVVAGVTLRPGDHVYLDADGRAVLAPHMSRGGGIGIVDPFLEELVDVGQRFWLVVYPGQITSLRHVWEHPAFPASTTERVLALDLDDAPSARMPSETPAEAEQWLRDWADTHDIDADMMIEALRTGSAQSPRNDWHSYSVNAWAITSHGSDAYASIPDEFWERVDQMLGGYTGPRPDTFSCSC